MNVWASIIDAATPSPRDEILLNINPACGLGYVNPNAGIRVGDYKLLVDCFNTTTLAPSGKVELYNIAADEYEKTDLAAAQPATVAELMQRLKVYAQSADQVPPTLFYPFVGGYNRADGKPAVASWNYQCPKCRQGGAMPVSGGMSFDPWCDDVDCAASAE